jgi:hypothetical protein
MNPPRYGMEFVDARPPRGLEIGAADDPAEFAAHRATERIMPPAGSVAARAPARAAAYSRRPAPASVHRVLASTGQALDANARRMMESRFGADLGGVRVHADAAAAASAATIEARAYANGDRIAFAAGQYRPETPSGQRLLAHEIAHVIQHRQGSAGERATVRRYTEYDNAEQTAGKSLGWVHPAGDPLRVAGDGQLAAEEKGWGANQSKRAWASTAKIASANAALAKAGSNVTLAPQAATISGKPPATPTGAAVSLKEVVPTKSAGVGAFELAQDCGSAAKQVMGSPGAAKDVAVLKSGATERYTQARDYHGGDPTTPEEFSEEVYKKEFGSGLTRAKAYEKYAALSATEKDKFDKKYGINKYARPNVGQGLTVSTEKDMPGFKEVSGFTWNFHYAAVVLTSASDYVTLENAAGWAATDWIFYMYGPASKKQSFHEFHGATQTHGSDWTTLVVEPAAALSVLTNVADAPLVIGSAIIKLALGTALKVSEKTTASNVTWLTVEVTAGTNKGKKGKIRSTYVD